MSDDKIGFRTWMYLRVGYPLENAMIRLFGVEHDCGCADVFGSRRRWCWQHAMEHLNPKN